MTSASAADCCQSRTAAGLLVGGALRLGDVPDRLLEGGALLERQPAAERELAPPARPGHAQRAPRVERLVVLDHRRDERARDERDRARRLADRDARELGIGLGRRELGGGRDLVERQRARAERVVERGQAAQRALVRVMRTAVRWSLLRDLREPLRARRAARRLPVALVVGLAHDLRDPLRDPRLLRAERAQLAPTRLAAPLTRLIDRPLQRREHTFEDTRPRTRQGVPKLCRNSGASCGSGSSAATHSTWLDAHRRSSGGTWHRGSAASKPRGTSTFSEWKPSYRSPPRR